MRSPGLMISVPASTSNLGPGFDTLGLALGLWLDVGVRPAADGEVPGACVRRSGQAESWPQQDNLLWLAFRAGQRLAGVEEPAPVVFEARSEIPLARGLGSSGAAVAAGLLLGSAWAREGTPLSPIQLAARGAALEGHPDNSTASLFGGCTLALPGPDDLHVLQQPLHPDLGFAVAWPTRPMATVEARAALPSEVSLEHAIDNPRRLAFLLEGLRRGDLEALALGGLDHLHVPYRLPLLPGAAEALEAARQAGASLATISGSGSTLVAVGPRDRMADAAEALGAALATRTENGPVHQRVVEPVQQAPEPRPWDTAQPL